jgi:hypothetical protein
LIEIPKRGDFFSFFGLFERKKYDEPEMGHEDLIQDLARLERDRQRHQIESDYKHAQELNFQEYEDRGELLTCNCCYCDLAWEDVVSCSECHFFCYPCLVKVAEESVFGQQKTLLQANGISCFHVDGCQGCFSFSSLSIAFYRKDREKEAESLVSLTPQNLNALAQSQEKSTNHQMGCRGYSRFMNCFVKQSALQAGLACHVCPRCDYIEIPEDAIKTSYFSIDAIKKGATSLFTLWFNPTLLLPQNYLRAWLNRIPFVPRNPQLRYVFQMLFNAGYFLLVHVVLVNLVAIISPAWALVVHAMHVCLFTGNLILRSKSFQSSFQFRSPERKTSVSGFQCQNPYCQANTCSECQGDFYPFHKCFDSIDNSLNQYIELAMSNAIKRVVSVSISFFSFRIISAVF